MVGDNDNDDKFNVEGAMCWAQYRHSLFIFKLGYKGPSSLIFLFNA